MELTLVDLLAIHELAARYGTLVDDRDWGALATIFTEDATYEIVGFGAADARYEGLDAIRELMRNGDHPVAHHVTNVLIGCDGAEPTMRSKILGTNGRGDAGSADYADVLRRTPAGWRIVRRVVTLRRPKP